MPVGGKAAGGVPGVKKGRAGFGHFKSRPVAFAASRPHFRSARNRGQDGIASAGGRVSGAGAGRRPVVVGAGGELLALAVVVDEGHL